MATTTTNLGLTKPALSESADVGVINENSDKIDAEAGKSRANFAATYSASSAYAVGDYCERGGNLYRCTTAIASGGEAWNSGHWTQVAVTGEIPKVIDNLTSTSATAALSAKQGKELSDQMGKQEFDCGTKTIPANSGTGTLDIGVTFNRTFTHAPKVVATFNETPPFATFENGYVGVTNISTSGCHLRVAALQNSSYTWDINWVAVNIES